MTTLAKRDVRKALEAPLRAALMAAGVVDDDGKAAIAFPNLEHDPRDLAAYVRFTVHYADGRVMEMGGNPLTQNSGFAFLMVYTRAGQGADANDTICKALEAAYAYNAKLTFGSVSVIVAETQHGDGAPDGQWWAAPVKVMWNLWRNL